MRQKKRLSRSPHPRSVFSRTPYSVTTSTSQRHKAPSITQSKHRVRAAVVRIARQEVIVVQVKSSLVTDVFEAQLALSAIELTCGKPAVLWAYEPCGCRDLFGRREHIARIDQMEEERLDWQHLVIDFARPAIAMLPQPN